MTEFDDDFSLNIRLYDQVWHLKTRYLIFHEFSKLLDEVIQAQVFIDTREVFNDLEI